ncbi:transposase domain-containing protein [Rhizobium mongolense]
MFSPFRIEGDQVSAYDPFAWLAQILQRIAAGRPHRDLDQLLPLNRHAG